MSSDNRPVLVFRHGSEEVSYYPPRKRKKGQVPAHLIWMKLDRNTVLEELGGVIEEFQQAANYFDRQGREDIAECFVFKQTNLDGLIEPIGNDRHKEIKKTTEVYLNIMKYLKENGFRLLASSVNLVYLVIAVFLALAGLPRFIQFLQGMDLQQVASSLFTAWLFIANFMAAFVYVFSNHKYRYVAVLSFVSFFLLLLLLGLFALQERYFYFVGSIYVVYVLLLVGRRVLNRHMPLPTEAK